MKIGVIEISQELYEDEVLINELYKVFKPREINKQNTTYIIKGVCNHFAECNETAVIPYYHVVFTIDNKGIKKIDFQRDYSK